ncbi:TrkH family potassium uptake protein [Corynebacterium sp. TAE3-ERU12]|uniref:TrkH family potassium uptake protein n=1 Tax=Corynebacterium sp. TAE3-ERU12 TaxID=2849491 RepID=UPI001C44A5E9|nr:potassium transporter TrkG [Corynebacterium sp. TAE3-ERU12]MBV7295877.1 TrkH family potassium uptake protein [Corynebacterium sp. TAE3-ERU12]
MALVRRPRPQAAVAVGFASIILIGTALLMAPFSTAPGHTTSPSDALFTATSAACLTGLVTVDTATHWSHIGQFIIMVLIQLGGLGFMTLASLAILALSGQMGLRARDGASAEGRGVALGSVSAVARATLLFTLVVEVVVAAVLTARFHSAYDMPLASAVWQGVFHSISGFNNAGFALYSDNVIGFVSDAWVLLPLAFALMVGGLGFPVLREVWLRPRRWSLTARLTFIGTAVLVPAGVLLVAFGEWEGAMAGLSFGDKLLNAFFAGVSPRTAGFNALDYAEFHRSTLIGTDILMFIGAGSGGTTGGVKVTTAAVLVAAVIAEVRGDNSVALGGRTVPAAVLRQALSILSFGVLLVVGSTTFILFVAPQFSTDQILFETTSAFATVGLSTGITGVLPLAAQFNIILLMFAGRVGPVALATAMAMRPQVRRYTYPEERPFIG